MIFISNIFQKIFLFIILFTIFICVFFIPILQNSNLNYNIPEKEFFTFNPNSYGFIWPIPGYTSISSPFGKRNAPTSGASSFHYGTDIPAPEGTKLIAIHDGEITFCSFLGAGGFTITLSFDNYKISYCHVSPDFIVKIGDHVKQGQVIRCCSGQKMFTEFLEIFIMTLRANQQMEQLQVVICIFGFRINDQYVNPINYFV